MTEYERRAREKKMTARLSEDEFALIAAYADELGIEYSTALRSAAVQFLRRR